MTVPIFISFYAGRRYYYDAAEQLRADLDALSIPHDIEEVAPPADRDWADICRMKPAFIQRKLEQHRRPVFWLDVDSRVLKRPTVLEGLRGDFAAFLRGFSRLQDFDPVQRGRTFVPGFLFFNYSEGARRLAAQAAEMEATSEVRATDDYFLEEAWRAFEGHLDVTLLSPAGIDLGKPNAAPVEDPWLQVGLSGSVRSFITQVEQHKPAAFETQRLFGGLQSLAQEEVQKGRMTEATVYLRRMVALDPAHGGALRTLARVLRRQGRLAEALGEYETRLAAMTAEPPDDRRLVEFLSNYFDFTLESGRLPEAAALLGRMTALGDAGATALARSKAYRLSLETEARQTGQQAARVPLWWMEQPYPGNFGDALNPYLVHRLSGAPPRFVPAGTGVLAIGSIIKFARAKTKVWGSGSPRLTDRLNAEATYCAVRGPLTRRLVRDSGGTCPEIYGDPALLLPRLYHPRVTKRHALGLIRHHVHTEEPIQLAPDVTEIDILRCGAEEIEAFIDEVLACSMIVSTSLHGLIVAHAYGIPAVWADFSGAGTRIQGNHVKFLDYFASVGIEETAPVDLSGIELLSAEMVRGRARHMQAPPDLDRLLDAAPFQLRLGQAARPVSAMAELLPSLS